MPVSRFSRYYGLKTIQLKGKVSLEQRPSVDADTSEQSITHTLIGNETLEQLAKHYYGREDLWWRIADANPARFPLDWKAGESLMIPPISLATHVVRR